MNDEQTQAERRIAAATRALRETPVEVGDVRRARLWANIDAGRREPVVAWWPTWTFAGPVVAAAALFVLGLWLWRANEVVTEPIAPAVAERPQTSEPKRQIIESGDGTIEVLANALVEMPALSPVRLVQGRVLLELPSRPPPLAAVRLATPVATIRLVAGQALVDVTDDVTTVEVQSGRAVVDAHGNEQTVLAGSSVRVEREERAEAPAMDEARQPRRVKPEPIAEVFEAPSDDEEITRARRLVRRDAPSAERVAKAVLKRRPTPRIEARALMVLADVERLGQRRDAAAALYQRVLDLPQGRDFFEEAALRRAELLVEMTDTRGALRALRDDRVGPGPLLPERRALEVRLILSAAGIDAAADRLEESAAIDGVQMQRVRMDVAERLVDSDPGRARSIAEDVVERGASSRLSKRAHAIIEGVEKK